MKNNKLLAVILTAALLLGGCGGSAGEEQVVTQLEDGTRTIGYYVGGELLQNIPDMQTNGFFGAVTECNDSCHMATYQSTTKEEYDAYVKLLEKEGYVLQAGGGDYGIHNQVFYTALKKEETTIHLVYQERLKCTSVIVGDKEAENGTVSVRTRTGVDLGAMPVDEFIARIQEEIRSKSI